MQSKIFWSINYQWRMKKIVGFTTQTNGIFKACFHLANSGGHCGKLEVSKIASSYSTKICNNLHIFHWPYKNNGSTLEAGFLHTGQSGSNSEHCLHVLCPHSNTTAFLFCRQTAQESAVRNSLFWRRNPATTLWEFSGPDAAAPRSGGESSGISKIQMLMNLRFI